MNSYLVIEKESVEKQREIEEHQKIITVLTLQLRDKDKENEILKQRLQGNWYSNNNIWWEKIVEMKSINEGDNVVNSCLIS